MVSQILAVLIFLVMFALIITEKIERHIVTLGCGLLMIILVFGITMHSGSAIMDDLGCRYGNGRFFPLALSADCMSCSL